MRQLKIFWLLSLGTAAAISFDVLPAKVAHAQQDVRIVSPQEGQDVRGEITARFEGIPQGGYAVVKIDGQFQQASAQDFVVLDTISDRVTFARGDGAYKLEVTVLNSGGKRVGTSTVNFNVANGKVDAAGKPVRLVHWSLADNTNGLVQRFRVFAESNATITGGTAAGGGAAGGEGGASLGGAPAGGAAIGGRGGKGGALGGGAAAGGAAASGYVEAPLDFQVSALMRRILRDTNMLNGSANIATIVQEGFERQREGAGDGAGGAGAEGAGAGPAAGGGAGRKPAGNGLGKAPWNQDDKGNALWNPAPETGKYFIKMIQPNGNEINATRKAPSLALADLLPTFPDVPVRPGSTWGTTMSFVGELSSRTPINVKDAPMTFTSYEDIQTPGGENRRCAKLESRFRLPDNLAKRIAVTLANKTGSAGGGAAGGDAGGALAGPGGAGASAGGAGAGNLTEDDIQVARTDVARVIWFDVERRRILRAEDTIRSNFDMPITAADAGGAAGGAAPGAMGGRGGAMGLDGGAGGAPAAPAEPERVAYNLSVTTWLDDRVPKPTDRYVPGGAGAHTRDSVVEPGLSRILRGNVLTP